MALFTKLIKQGNHCTIRAIAKQNGDMPRCEILEFIQDVRKSQPNELSKITALFKDAAQRGPPQNTEKFKKLKNTDGIYEFRISKLRLLCFYDNAEASLIVCTHGFIKKTQKTPEKHITHAEQLKREYFNKQQEGTLIHEK
jgi:phage-related protein